MPDDRPQDQPRADHAYESPAITVLGPIDELTLDSASSLVF